MIPDGELILRLVLAATLGSAIGIERERLLWAAGLRTHMVVCVGACLIMVVSTYGFTSVLGPHVILDPSRVAAQVVSGVGFICAGSIILRNEVVKGLTTAASLWAVAAVGLAVGGGLYLAAGVATVIMLLILAGIKPLEERFRDGRRAVQIHFRADRGAAPGLVEQTLGWRSTRVKRLLIRPSETLDIEDVQITFGPLARRDIDETIRNLSRLPSVTDVREVYAE